MQERVTLPCSDLAVEPSPEPLRSTSGFWSFRPSLIGSAVALGLIALGCHDGTVTTDVVGTSSGEEQERVTARIATEDQPLVPLLNIDHPRRIPGQWLVRLRHRLDEDALHRLVALPSVKVLSALPAIRTVWLSASAHDVAALRTDTSLRYIEADIAAQPLGAGDSSRTGVLDYMDRVDQRLPPLDDGYSWSTTGAGVHLWIIDNGVDRYDTFLAGRVDPNVFWTYGGRDPLASCIGSGGSHGNEMAVRAAGVGYGVAHGAIVHSARVDATACDDYSIGAVTSALVHIGTHSPRPAIANLSLIIYCVLNTFCGNTFEDAVEWTHDQGVFITTGAGNQWGNACGNSPSRVSKAFTLAESHPLTDVENFAQGWGPCVDMFAPTGDEGTSYASAMGAGVAALYLQLYPSASPSQVRAWLIQNSTTGALTLFPNPESSPNRLLYSRQPPLITWIAGSSSVGPFATCTWHVSWLGGQPPYGVQWYRNGTVVAAGNTYSVSPGETEAFELLAIVTDGVGRTASDLHSVYVDASDMSFVCGALQ